jgi:hypothetical protein
MDVEPEKDAESERRVGGRMRKMRGHPALSHDPVLEDTPGGGV